MRIGAGTIAAAYALLGVGGVMGWVLLAGGIGMALTGIFGFCPACALAGRRLEKRPSRESAGLASVGALKRRGARNRGVGDDEAVESAGLHELLKRLGFIGPAARNP